MNLRNVQIIGTDQGPSDIEIANGKIASISSFVPTNKQGIFFGNAVVFPGLINSHDHLEFNLFPQLRGRIYTDYKDWGSDIHEQFGKEINSVLEVPKQLRIDWGIIKNLLNGVTTVVDHRAGNPDGNQFIGIYRNFNYLHSLATEFFWKLKLNNPFDRRMPMIHIGEGVSLETKREINTFINWNFLNKPIVGIHGISMDDLQANKFNALVWCPDSNLFLYEQTAPIRELKKYTSILFGTDSTLSASGIVWDQMRMARGLRMLNDTELFDSLTSTPAKLFGINADLNVNTPADLVVAKRKVTESLWDSFYSIKPEDILLILKHGRVIYFDASLINQVEPSILSDFKPFQLNGIRKYMPASGVKVLKSLQKYKLELPFTITCHD